MPKKPKNNYRCIKKFQTILKIKSLIINPNNSVVAPYKLQYLINVLNLYKLQLPKVK